MPITRQSLQDGCKEKCGRCCKTTQRQTTGRHPSHAGSSSPTFDYKQTKNYTRGHKHKLIKPRANLNLRLHNFSHRVINAWNNLPAFIVESHSVNSFKHHLSVYLSVNSGL
jgi:hypothetical protein